MRMKKLKTKKGRVENMLKEFKKFALRGNMIDLAVGIIIGGAFTGLVNSLVNDIIMPVLNVFTKNIDFTNLFIALDGVKYETLDIAKEAGAATINYGAFISGIINFLIMAFVVFLLVRWINRLRKPVQDEIPTTKTCPYCYSEIHIDAVLTVYLTLISKQQDVHIVLQRLNNYVY